MEEVTTESEGEISSLPNDFSSKRRQRIDSDISLTEHHTLQSCSASSHNPRQSTSSTSSQESTDFAEIDEERVRNWRLQRVVLASDSSSESGEGRVTKSRKTGPMREKQLGAGFYSRQRSHRSIKPNKYQFFIHHSKQSSQALMFDAPTVDMCSLEEEIEAVTGGSSHDLDTSTSTLPRPKQVKQPLRSRHTRKQPSVTRSAQAKISRVSRAAVGSRSSTSDSATDMCSLLPRKSLKKVVNQDVRNEIKEVVGADDSTCSNQRNRSESDVEPEPKQLTAVGSSPLLSPEIELQNRLVGDNTQVIIGKDKTSVTYGQHIKTLASWEKIALLGEKATKGPMLFAQEHLKTRLQVQEDWMTKARYIWSQWKKLSRESRSVYTATAKRNRMKRSPRKRYVAHKSLDTKSPKEVASTCTLSQTGKSSTVDTDVIAHSVQMTVSNQSTTPTITQTSTHQLSSLLTSRVPPVTQRVSEIASQYFQEHSLPGDMSPSFADNSSLLSPSFAQGTIDTSLSFQSSVSAHLAVPTSSSFYTVNRAVGEYYNRSYPSLSSVSSSALASSDKDKSIKSILSSTNLKPVYHSTAEAPHILSGVPSSRTEPSSKQSPATPYSPLNLTQFPPPTPVDIKRISSPLVSPTSSLPLFQCPLSQPILYQTTSKQQYSIAGMQSGSEQIVSHLGPQNRPQPSASIGSNMLSATNSYSIATMHVHRSSATVHHKPTSIASSTSTIANNISTTNSSPVHSSSFGSFSPATTKSISQPITNHTNKSLSHFSHSPTIPSILASSTKPEPSSTSTGLTEVSDEWRKILLERVKELGIKKQLNASSAKKVTKPSSKKRQRRRSDSLSLTSTSTGGLCSPFTRSPQLPSITSPSFPFFPEVSLPCTTMQSEITNRVPSSDISNEVAVPISEHQCLVAGEPSELHSIIPVAQKVAKTLDKPPATTGTGTPNALSKSIISGLPCTINSSPTTPNVVPFSPIFNTASSANPPSAYNYADLERHYWQCLIQLEHHKQYTETVHQHLKEAFHHQQIMLLQSDKYQEFLHKLVSPDWKPQQLDRLNHSTTSLPEHEFGGTFDRPVVKRIL